MIVSIEHRKGLSGSPQNAQKAPTRSTDPTEAGALRVLVPAPWGDRVETLAKGFDADQYISVEAAVVAFWSMLDQAGVPALLVPASLDLTRPEIYIRTGEQT